MDPRIRIPHQNVIMDQQHCLPNLQLTLARELELAYEGGESKVKKSHKIVEIKIFLTFFAF